MLHCGCFHCQCLEALITCASARVIKACSWFIFRFVQGSVEQLLHDGCYSFSWSRCLKACVSVRVFKACLFSLAFADRLRDTVFHDGSFHPRCLEVLIFCAFVQFFRTARSASDSLTPGALFHDGQFLGELFACVSVQSSRPAPPVWVSLLGFWKRRRHTGCFRPQCLGR